MEYMKTLILNNTSLSEELILNLLKDYKNYDVLIINYETDNLNTRKLMETAKNSQFSTFNC